MPKLNDVCSPAYLKFLARLGVEVPAGITKSESIAFLKNNPPTPEQLSLASKWGVQIERVQTAGQLFSMLKVALARAGHAAMRENPALRAGAVITFEERVYVVTHINASPHRPMISLMPVNGGRVEKISAGFLAEVREKRSQ